LRRILRAIATWESPMRALYTRLIKDNAGVTAIEYGLIAALVAVVCIAVWSTLGSHLSTVFTSVSDSL
jgi:pilus assembly protein Flp/PilA